MTRGIEFNREIDDIGEEMKRFYNGQPVSEERILSRVSPHSLEYQILKGKDRIIVVPGEEGTCIQLKPLDEEVRAE